MYNTYDGQQLINEKIAMLKQAIPQNHYKTKTLASYLKSVDIAKETLQNSNNVVMVLGSTGAGKSTLVNYLQGASYEKDPVFDIVKAPLRLSEKSKEYAQTSDCMGKSTTTIPGMYNHNTDFVYVDFPGFGDLSDDEECLLASALVARYFFRYVKSIKAIVVVTNIDEITATRGKYFLKLVETLQTVIKELDLVKSSLFFLLNKFEDDIEKHDYTTAVARMVKTLQFKMTGDEGLIARLIEDKRKAERRLSKLNQKSSETTEEKNKKLKKINKLMQTLKKIDNALQLVNNLRVKNIYSATNNVENINLRVMFADFTDQGKFRQQFEQKMKQVCVAINPENFYFNQLNIDLASVDGFFSNYLVQINKLLVLCNDFVKTQEKNWKQDSLNIAGIAAYNVLVEEKTQLDAAYSIIKFTNFSEPHILEAFESAYHIFIRYFEQKCAQDKTSVTKNPFAFVGDGNISLAKESSENSIQTKGLKLK